MFYKTTFLTRKVFNNDLEKLIIKNGYVLNTDKIIFKKQLKKIQKEKEYKELNKDKQLNLFTLREYEEKKKELDTKYSPKLENAVRSMNRSKNNLMDILRCNKFDFFITLTFNSKIDRLNDLLTQKLFRQWMKNVSIDLPNFYYVAVPEYHKKGGLHYHLLVGGVSFEDLKMVDSGKKVKNGRCKGQIIYNVNRWKKGFSTATTILDNDAVKNYVSKYLTKGSADIRFFNKKRYFTSINIKRPLIEKYEIPLRDNLNFLNEIKSDYNIDYENLKKEYCVLSKKL